MPNPERNYDLIISGAGFAGLSAAIIASKKLDRVLLIDRNPSKNVGKKPHGDGYAEMPLGSHTLIFWKRRSA